MSSRRPTLLVSLALTLSCASHGWADPVDDLVVAEMSKQKIPGLAVAVVKDGKIVKTQGYGLAEIELAASANADTVFQIQSLTKQFTAVAVMMLVEEGKVGLDASVAAYLPDAPAAWEKMTIRDLLGQTSGLKDFINDPVPSLAPNISDENLLKSVEARPLNFEPGTGWQYSNTNYLLLGMIIGKASGQPYGDFLAARIFKPLGMTRTAVMRAGEIVPGRALGYLTENGRLRTGYSITGQALTYAGGGIRSTAPDLAKWDAALDADKLLRRETLQQMWAPVRLRDGTTHPYGFGWDIGATAGHRLVSHGGSFTSGFRSQINRYPDDQLTVIVLTNYFNADPAKIARAVGGVYVPALAPKVYQPIADPEPALTAHLFDVVRRMMAGGLKEAEFTPDVWAYLAPRAEQSQRDMAPLGPVQQLTLVERVEENGGKSLRYQIRFGRTTLLFHFVLTADGKIAVMAPEV